MRRRAFLAPAPHSERLPNANRGSQPSGRVDGLAWGWVLAGAGMGAWGRRGMGGWGNGQTVGRWPGRKKMPLPCQRVGAMPQPLSQWGGRGSPKRWQNCFATPKTSLERHEFPPTLAPGAGGGHDPWLNGEVQGGVEAAPSRTIVSNRFCAI